MAKHTDHNGNILQDSEVNAYWKGYVNGIKNTEPNQKIYDETLFERYLVGFKDFRLEEGQDNISNLSSMGTLARIYVKGKVRIMVGILADPTRIGIFSPNIEGLTELPTSIDQMEIYLHKFDKYFEMKGLLKEFDKSNGVKTPEQVDEALEKYNKLKSEIYG